MNQIICCICTSLLWVTNLDGAIKSDVKYKVIMTSLVSIRQLMEDKCCIIIHVCTHISARKLNYKCILFVSIGQTERPLQTAVQIPWLECCFASRFVECMALCRCAVGVGEPV